ncbi:MAG: DNA polymerase/3'-5' exonuclease PolX [Candidatus Thorarchaeota archaeon]|nr:MAG: DNA polymerase/3'-5' exonuclease PolX [Candidatus Thorarchaeota archaeon]
MLSKNAEVAQVLEEIGLLLDIEGKDRFRPLAYHRGARAIKSLGEDVVEVARRNELTKIPGIGKGLAKIITNYIETGQVPKLDELRTRVPIKVMELMAIRGVGPRTVKLMYDKLGITDLESLERAASDGSLSQLPGLGDRSVKQILQGIELVRQGLERTLLADALIEAEKIVSALRALPSVRQIEVAGSARRRRETVGDLDILVNASDTETIMGTFVGLESVAEVLARGTTKSSVRLTSNLQIDLRVIPAESFGAGLQYFTGSVDHNVKLRSIAQKMGLKLNEYGLFRGEEKVEGREERAIYESLGMTWVPPELREDRGEIEAAQDGTLPDLITPDAVRGDLHTHTDQSDGRNTIEEMIDAAQEREYEYFCISDHTKSLTIANGMDEERLEARINEIDRLNESGRWKMRILKGAEVDILQDGELDISDDLLSRLDIVTASIHSRMNDSKRVMTERVCHALENKFVHILGHPTGRLLLKRPPFEIDLSAVFEVARKNNVIMELNAHPQRLDLNAGNLRSAVRAGLRIAVNTDAHSVAELDNMTFGIYQARRGWLTKDDIINTHTLKKLLRLIKK